MKVEKRRNPTVSALLLSWEENDLKAVPGETEELADVLSQGYGASITHWKIPSEEPFLKLNSAVSNFLVRDNEAGNLIIVYYGGHGVSSPDQCCWAAYVLV